MNKTKGSGLIFAVVLLFVILGMVITLSSITVLETKMNQKSKSSVGAFYNADSGVEWALNQIATTTNSSTTTAASRFSIVSGNKAACPAGFGCDVYFLKEDGTVADPFVTYVSDIKAVRSVGTQGGETQRAIEAAVADSNNLTFSIVDRPATNCNAACAALSPAMKCAASFVDDSHFTYIDVDGVLRGVTNCSTDPVGPYLVDCICYLIS